ncbi:MAG: hypothetical protein WCG47_20575, partial [Dermatophilaceae bacterium]
AYRDAELLAVALHEALAGQSEETAALTTYQNQRDLALRDVFELTIAMSTYPGAEQIVALQKQLGRALDAAAVRLAAGPLPDQGLLIPA